LTTRTYHGTHRGNFLGIAGTGATISFETVDATIRRLVEIGLASKGGKAKRWRRQAEKHQPCASAERHAHNLLFAGSSPSSPTTHSDFRRDFPAVR
jgi:hypothetical protein